MWEGKEMVKRVDPGYIIKRVLVGFVKWAWRYKGTGFRSRIGGLGL